MTLSTAAAYLLCIPIFLRHEMAVSKGVMMFLHIAGWYVIGLVLHLMLKLMGSRGVTWKETMGLYGYQLGVQTVGYTLLMYPSFLSYKQVALSLLGQEVAPSPLEANINVLAAALILTVWAVAALAPMYARYHRLATWGKTRVAVAFSLTITISWPFLLWAIPWLYKVGKYL